MMMKVRAGQVCMGMALVFFFLSMYQIILYSTNWVIVLCAIGFSLVLGALAVAFEWMSDIDTAFLHMTKALSENITQLVNLNRQIASRNSSIKLTFTGTAAQPWHSTFDNLDLLSLSELRDQLREAEKSEDYTRAARIRDKIRERGAH